MFYICPHFYHLWYSSFLPEYIPSFHLIPSLPAQRTTVGVSYSASLLWWICLVVIFLKMFLFCPPRTFILVGYFLDIEILSRLFSFQYFKDVASVFSGLHCFWWEVNHSSCCCSHVWCMWCGFCFVLFFLAAFKILYLILTHLVVLYLGVVFLYVCSAQGLPSLFKL